MPCLKQALTDGRQIDLYSPALLCAGYKVVRIAERLVDEQSGMAFLALGTGHGVKKTNLDRIIAVLRPCHPQMMLVCWYGAGREAVRMAERLVDEQSGVAFFALGVGRGVEKTELDRIIGVCGEDKVPSRYMPLCTIDEAPW